MQRLLAFIEQNLFIILFVILQAVCAFLIFSFNPYQQASFSNSAAKLTANTNKISNDVTDYLDLKTQNQLLQSQLANQFKSTGQGTLHYLNDTFVVRDTAFSKPLFSLAPAQVVYNSVHKADNIFIINKGLNHGINKNMGVISSEGIAGIVLNSNANFSTVMSMLNTNMNITPSINGEEYFTELIWNNESPYCLKIKNINKLEEIKVGDLVTTGKSSLLFPSGIPIGNVSSLKKKNNSQYFDTDVKLSTNFRALEYVYVVINHHKEELDLMIENVE